MVCWLIDDGVGFQSSLWGSHSLKKSKKIITKYRVKVFFEVIVLEFK